MELRKYLCTGNKTSYSCPSDNEQEEINQMSKHTQLFDIARLEKGRKLARV
jgi:hypothetical protein